MPEDAPVNTDAVAWPSADSAYFAVREMQIKLHRWAGEDSSRRFGDLFNLVYDPAFLVHAWERVSTNKGARTPGDLCKTPAIASGLTAVPNEQKAGDTPLRIISNGFPSR